MSTNVPSSIVNWLLSFTENKETLVIHLSTDQVYEGVKSFYKEEDETVPVNVYGKIKKGKQMQLLLNVGGPDRVSRVQMAEAVADIRGYNTSLIKPVSASSVDRGVMSPADISMDITKLVQTLNICPVTFRDGVKLTLAEEAKS
ncbi:hypothetical protein Patl1_00392 [Pistacia atlantica]|uniref:Uncharacterized protein n=1 Tax=Pistacia atlantica TaxID=434234 RepID=A0ACC1C9J7_9ROSI|nr:hypothetical protein Patl1_00392 [Pistacia atlantica]